MAEAFKPNEQVEAQTNPQSPESVSHEAKKKAVKDKYTKGHGIRGLMTNEEISFKDNKQALTFKLRSKVMMHKKLLTLKDFEWSDKENIVDFSNKITRWAVKVVDKFMNSWAWVELKENVIDDFFNKLSVEFWKQIDKYYKEWNSFVESFGIDDMVTNGEADKIWVHMEKYAESLIKEL